MKKIMMLFLTLIFIFNVKDVFAQDQYQLTLEKQEGIYFSRRGVNFDNDSYPFYLYKFGNIFAYCIEPGKHITTYTYTGVEDYIDLPFSEELKEKLELIGYYGREYPGHNNIRYSMAAQALIWELTGVDTVTFWTEQYERGNEIDVTPERNEIMRLVNNHKTLPNFKTSYEGFLKKELTIYDSNKVLGYYEITNKGMQDVYIDSNTLHILPKNVGSYNIELKRKSYDEYNTIIFVGKGDNSSQKLGRLHFNKDIKMNINIAVKGVSLLIHKVDENNNLVPIKNIMFNIKNKTTGEYICKSPSQCFYRTDSEGKVLTEPLDYGEYEIEEVENQIINGYTWNSEKLNVVISEDKSFKWDNEMNNYMDVYFKNNSIKFFVEVTKTGEIAVFENNSVTYQDGKLSNITFDVYTKEGEYVNSGVTDKNGVALIGNLKRGNYYLKERETTNNYIIKDKIPFMVSQASQYITTAIVHLNVKNELKKGNIEFSKVDCKTNKGIPNTIIEIYNENNKLLFTKETNSNGQVFIDNIPIGKYYIKEKEANYYYEKTNDIVNFEIKEDGETVKPKMTNNKIKGKIQVEKLGEEFNITNNIVNYKTIKLPNIEFNLYNENNELITTLKTNSNGYTSYELELGKYYLTEKTKLPNYLENNDKYSFEIKKDGNKAIPIKLTISNYLKKGNLEFTKEDIVTHLGVIDTIIEIYNINNKVILTKKTDKNGKILINNLPIGKYLIKEKEANYFYKVSDEVIEFEIKNNGEIIKKSLGNEKILGNLEINKKGENYHFINNNIYYDKENLHAIEFDLYDSNDNLIDHIITDNNGYAKYANLPLGKYYLMEKTGLSRFMNSGNKYEFEIKKKDLSSAFDVSLEIVNYLKKASLEFSKVDSKTNEGIPNTIIEIYNKNNILLFTKETDKDGKVIVNNIPYGKYYIKEKEANYYYQKTNEVINFDIKENDKIVKVKMNNDKIVGNLEIEKIGEEYKIVDDELIYEKIKLEGIKFDLYDDSDNLIETLISDKNGFIKYTNLPLGKYYLVEKTNLDNYIDNKDKVYFEIKKDGYKGISVKLTINNYLKKGNLEFSKLDLTTSKGIPNTIIEIYNENDNLWLTKTTDEFGKVIIPNLPIGKYYIIEKEANSLYMLTNEKVFFEIKEDGAIVKATMTNEKIEVPVYKTNTNESIITNTIFVIGLLIGLGRMYYEKKESY